MNEVDWSDHTTTNSSIDLLRIAIRNAFNYKCYAGKTEFKVIALTPSIPLTAIEASSLPGGSAYKGLITRHIIWGRVIDNKCGSLHSGITDPCIMEKGDAQAVLNHIKAHTCFIVYGDPSASMRVPVKPGDIFLGKLEDTGDSYDLQYGRFLEVLNRAGIDKPYHRIQKACNKSLKNIFPVFPEFGDGLGIGPKDATYKSESGDIPIMNGKLPDDIMGEADPRWSTGGKFLKDLLPSFDALAKAYFEAHNSKKLKLNGTYRTYEKAKGICGVIQSNGKCTNNLSSLPGTSRHGWAAAFDWQLTISWINEHGHKTTKARRHQFNCPEWRWMWANSQKHAVDGVFWTNPAWARPACGEGTNNTDASLATEEQLTQIGSAFCGAGGLLEAWHWEPSNFNQLITGIGR